MIDIEYLEYIKSIKVGDKLKVMSGGELFDCVATRVTDIYILVDCDNAIFEHFLISDGRWDSCAMIVRKEI